MMSTPPIIPIEKHVVLIGAGNAHLVFARRWGMRPLRGVAVTLVNEAPVVPYSAMVSGHIAGDYTLDAITIDLVRLCQAVKIRFLPESVAGIEPAARQVLFANRPPLSYDALSIGLGSLPARPGTPSNGDWSFVMRPLAGLLRKVERLEKQLELSPRPFHLAIVGGGASGCELALAIHRRLARHSGFRITVLQANETLLPQFPAGVAQAFETAFRQRGIGFRVHAPVTGSQDEALLLADGEKIACDAVLWATQAAPPGILGASGLAVDSGGFLQVKETLQSIHDPAVFGTGDCVSFQAFPELPRNGVHAVRQGAVLFDNVGRFLKEQALRPFRPQRFTLNLLNTADGEAMLSYGPLHWKSKRARRIKDRIDRAWIDKFTHFAPMQNSAATQEENYEMRCGGCGSKISSDILSAALKRLDLPDDPRVLLGCRAGEDAAVHQFRPQLYGTEPDKLVEVQTVDYFKAFVDDPYLFGRIAALNAVSDLYAMNARPFSALAIATLPYARGPFQEAQLYELLSGAVHSFRQLHVVLTGGHTTEGQELALGFSVTGFGEADRLFQKSNLQAGDRLILTKPLGSGALLAAWMRGECRAAWFERLKQSMLLANADAAAIFAAAGVRACTDVTGFGLAGHLLEMLDASKMSARLTTKEVPVYDGFADVVAAGIVSSLHRDNLKTACRVVGPTSLPGWLFDPQTSGGLLAAVKPEAAGATLDKLQQAGLPDARMIGEVLPTTSAAGSVIHIE
ncbi:MAG TPA: selenide, water dikinase SelD [Gemmataceae bacterium]|jgi:selenide,water dikinase|nr:selenide, water dikinase SelD [Gemmataceae bacterium]